MKWRRSAFTTIGGTVEVAPDDWTLVSDDGRNLARIYKVEGGPNAGRWFWAVQVDRAGRPWNGGTGTEATGGEAREACEARMPSGR